MIIYRILFVELYITQNIVLIGNTTFVVRKTVWNMLPRSITACQWQTSLHIWTQSQTRAAVATVTCIAMRRHEYDASLARDLLAVINSTSRFVIFVAADSEDSRYHVHRQKNRENVYFLILFSLFHNLF